MSSTYTIHFSHDGTEREYVTSDGNFYLLPDRTFLKVQVEPVWCRQCQEITDGEELGTAEAVSAQIVDLENETSEAFQRTETFEKDVAELFQASGIEPVKKVSHRESMLQKMRQRLEWRAARSSPPKCLKCGSTDLLTLASSKAVPSPCSPGTIQLKWKGFASVSQTQAVYSPEGIRLQKKPVKKWWQFWRTP